MSNPQSSPSAAPHAARAWSPIDEARLRLYHVLSLAASDPACRRGARLHEPRVLEEAAAAAEFLAAELEPQPVTLAPGELPPASLASPALWRLFRQPHGPVKMALSEDGLFAGLA